MIVYYLLNPTQRYISTTLPLHSPTQPCIALHNPTQRYIALHGPTQPYTTLHSRYRLCIFSFLKQYLCENLELPLFIITVSTTFSYQRTYRDLLFSSVIHHLHGRETSYPLLLTLSQKDITQYILPIHKQTVLANNAKSQATQMKMSQFASSQQYNLIWDQKAQGVCSKLMILK